MTAIPPNEVTNFDIAEWQKLDKQLKAIKGKEMMLRQKIFGGLFTAPREGTNNLGLPDGAVLKGGYVLNREVDPGALQAMTEKFNEENIFVDQLIKWTPSLKVKEYRELTTEQQKLFDQCLIIKVGAPQLEVAIPKRAISDLQMANIVVIPPIPKAP